MRNLLLLSFLLSVPFSLLAQKLNIYDRPLQSEPSHDFDVLHYKIELAFAGKNRAFRGKTTVSLRSLSNNLNSISLHAESFTVENVKTLGAANLAYNQSNGKLNVLLPTSKKYNDTIHFVVNYSTERFEVDPTDYGMGANYPLGLGFFEENEDHPFLFNAYSFPNGARHWFPCYDHPNDRATHETIITTQSDHKVLANGVLVSTTPNTDGTTTYHWSQEQAHPTYLYNFVSGPYVVVEDEYDGKAVNYWVYPKDEDKAMRSFHRTPEVLAFFEDYYGVKYPWDKYDQICVPGIGGGAEATTATLIGDRTLHDEKAEKDFPSHWLVAHEAAHHWFGDFISYRDWTQTWVSESFATFSEYLYSNHLYGPDEGALNLYDKRATYLNEAKNRYQRPIVFGQWRFPNQNFDRHTYQKGSLVLHMLRDYLGEDRFKRVLQHFLTQNAYQPVDSHDFIKSVLEVTGENLDWFFEQWLFKAGHPVLEIEYEWKNNMVELSVRQVQETDENVPLFKMPIKVAITNSQGTKTESVWLKEEFQSYSFPSKEKPLMVRFDPDHILLKELSFKKAAEELLYQAKNDNMLGRLWAVEQLAQYSAQEEVFNTLANILKEDAFWAVRRAALRSLSKAQVDTEAKAKLALQDEHSKVRAAAVQILGNLQLKSWAKAYVRLYEKEDSYVVQAELVRALGKLKDVKNQAFFEQVQKAESPRNLLRQAADWALNQLE